MTLEQVLRVIKHPVIFKRKAMFATRESWYDEGRAEVERLAKLDLTKPYRINVSVSYIAWSKKIQEPVAFLRDGDVLRPVSRNDFPQELLDATDYVWIYTEPHAYKFANRTLMTPDWLKTLPDLPNVAKELLNETL